MGLSWVRVGDLAVLWELQTFLRNLYFITVILLCVIAVSWMETPSLCCVMTACLSVWDFRFVLLLSLTLFLLCFSSFSTTSSSLLSLPFPPPFSPFPFLPSIPPFPSLLYVFWFYSVFLWWSLLSVMCRMIFYVHHCILPYPWANSLALIVYHCHPLTLKTATLRLGTMREAFSLQ